MKSIETMLARETLSDQIASRLAEYIATGLRAGDQLPSEASISEQFGVSRPVVREAFRSLVGQGIIEVVSGKGAIVRPFDDRLLRIFFRRSIKVESSTVLELMEVRKPLEMQSAALAAQRRTSAQLDALATTLSAMGEHISDLAEYAVFDVDFHLLVAEASHNTTMSHLISSIRDSLHEAIEEGLRRRNSRAEIEHVQMLHKLIYNAIAESDPDRAAQSMARHFDEAVTVLVTPEVDSGSDYPAPDGNVT